MFVAIKVIPRFLRRAKDTDSPELFLLVAIAICLGTAALAQAAGFSVALGAFLAGFSISASEDLDQAHAQLVPLRDAFVALFFVSLGTLIAPRMLAHSLVTSGNDASANRGRQIHHLDDHRAAPPVSPGNRNHGRFGLDTDRRAIVRSRTSRLVGRNPSLLVSPCVLGKHDSDQQVRIFS